MSGNFRKIYPNQESIVFDGGKNNKYPVALLPDNESPDCQNVIFYNGAVETRDGAVKLNPIPAGSNAFDGFYVRRDNSGAETMCVFIDGGMKTLNTTTFVTVPSAQSVFTIGSRVAAEFAENYMFIGNGNVTPYKYDGTLFTQHGVPAPTQTMTVVSNGVGNLVASATYMYKYTNINSALVESDVSPAITFVISSTSGQNVLSNIAVSPVSAGVARRRLYRTVANGSSFLKLAEISDNTTTSFTDNVADGSLGAVAPSDNGVPPNYNAILYHRNIVFVNDPANPNYVRYSAINAPYTFPQLNFFKIGDRTSDLVTGFAAYDNHLVVFCEKSVWINFMSNPGDPTTWRQLRTNSPYGSKSPYCALNYQNKVLFPAMQDKKFVGFAALSGMSLDPTSSLLTVTNAGSDLQSDRIEPDMFNVQEAYVKNITGILYKTRAYVTLTYGTGQTTNNRTYLFDFSLSNLKKNQHVSWVPMVGWNIQQFAIYAGKLYYASSDTTGSVFEIDGTGVYSDNGVAIDSYYKTKEFPGFDPDTNETKDFRYINFLADNSGGFFMSVYFRVDSDTGVGNSLPVSLDPGGSKWGSFVWGVDSWGGGASQKESRVFVGGLRGKRIQFEFTNQNTVGQKFKVYRMNFAYNLRGYR